MRLFALVLLVAACSAPDGPQNLPPDAGGDAPELDAEPEPEPAVPMPLSCETSGTLPQLPRICLEGWCLDAPSPIAHVSAMLALGTQRWFALPTHLVLTVKGHVSAYRLPAGPVTQLVGSVDAGVWAVGGDYSDHLMHFDGTSVQDMPSPGLIQKLFVVAANDLWAMNGGGVFHGDGATWTKEILPAEAEHLQVWTMAVTNSNHVWVAGDGYDEVNDRFVHYLLHRDHGVWQVIESPVRVYALWASGPHDVWISSGASLVHYDGTTFVEQAAIPAETVIGRSRNDVWTASGGPNANVAHWDGVSWTSCPRPGARALALGSSEVWVLGGDHGPSLARYDGQWADAPELSGLETIHPITGSTEVLAGGGQQLIRRWSVGTWNTEPGFPQTVVINGMTSRAPDDIWAFGYGAAHYDGSTWHDTHGPGSIRSFCTGVGVDAFVTTLDDIQHFDGQTWSPEAGISPGDMLLCPAADDIWFGNGVQNPVGHRVAGRWVTTATAPWIGRAFHVAGGPLWSIANNEFVRLDGAEWLAVDTRELASLLPAGTSEVVEISGRSPSDTWLVVQLRTGPVTVDDYLVHFDGTHFDRAIQQNGVKKVTALAPDDLIVVGSRFETVRLTSGTETTLSAGRTDVAIGYGSGIVYFASATDGWAISDEGKLLRFDGTTWSIVTSLAGTYTRNLLAFSPTDIWALSGGAALARWNGTSWSTTPIALLQPGESALGMWGANPNDVWITTTTARFIHVVNGVPSVLATGLPSAEQPHELGMIHGTSANDVWFSGTHLEQFQYMPALYHWDGTSITRYRTLRRAMAMGRLAGELYATGWDPNYGQEVWQRVGGRWIVRADLTPAQVFPTVFGVPHPPYGIDNGVGGGPWYAISSPPEWPYGGQVIWRRE